jgi:hypothetical protein
MQFVLNAVNTNVIMEEVADGEYFEVAEAI